jgi:hypothetical protein
VVWQIKCRKHNLMDALENGWQEFGYISKLNGYLTAVNP